MLNTILTGLLLLPGLAAAGDAGKGAAMNYTETGYFTVSLPAGWAKTEPALGLSKEEKKVFGAEFRKPADADGLSPKIAVFYYAPGNLLHKTPEKYIRVHSQPALGAAADGRQYGPVKAGAVGKYYAKIFERKTFEYVPPEGIKQKKVPVYEKFSVVPVKNGFYVLSYYSPMDSAKAGLADYEDALASFKLLVR